MARVQIRLPNKYIDALEATSRLLDSTTPYDVAPTTGW